MSSIFLRFPQGKEKALTLSYDDGVEQDIKLLEIMKKHGLKGTFNLNSGAFAPEGKVYPKGTIHRRMTAKAVLELYRDSGCEVAIHGLTHPWLETLTTDNIIYEIITDRKNLEDMFGCEVRGCAYPFGTYNDDVVEVLRMCGIAYSRTTKSTENFQIPTDWLRMPATCHHNNARLFELADEFLSSAPKRDGLLFYLWGHSYEFEDRNNWDRIEKFAEKVGGRDDVWYATNIEIYDYVQAFHSLRFSVDGRYVTNPTAIDVWFVSGNTEVFAPAGKRTEIR